MILHPSCRSCNKHLLPNSLPPDPKTEQPASPEGLKKIGGSVHPPHLVHSADPGIDEYASVTRISGDCLIYFVVGTDGIPSQFSIVRRAGAGLDEEALKAVQKYVFDPATEDGKPVAVALNININFRIF